MLTNNRTLPGNLLLSTLVALVFLASGSLNADVVTADFNGLSVDPLPGQAGGAGWSSNWGDSTSIEVINFDLMAPLSTNYGLGQSGSARSVQGKAQAGSQSSRALENNLVGEIWFSFLLNQPVNTMGEESRGGITFNVDGESSGNPRVIAVGNELRLGLSTLQGVGAGVTIPVGADMLILGRLIIDPGVGAEVLDVWVNPNVSGGIAGLNPADNSFTEHATSLDPGISRIGVTSYQPAGPGAQEVRGGIIDAIRFSDRSTAFADVTQVPEPTGATILGLASAWMFLKRRKRVRDYFKNSDNSLTLIS